MQQKLILTSPKAQTTLKKLTFNMPDIDRLFPGFMTGDFAVIYGSQSVTSLMSKLCVRAQLPTQLGGLDSNVVFIDAANKSSISNVVEEAELQCYDPKTVLERVIKMRAYTAYKLTSIIMENLKEAVEASCAKLVIISDIVCSFLSDNVDDQEAKAVFNQIMSYLSSFAKRHRIIIIATYLSHESNRRNTVLQEISTSKANTVLRFTKTLYTSEVELEKHPSYMLGVVEFNPENTILNDFTKLSSRMHPVSLNYKIVDQQVKLNLQEIKRKRAHFVTA